MSAFQRILVAVDGSDPSQAAVALAVRVARYAAASELIFCFVVDIQDEYRATSVLEMRVSVDDLTNEDRRQGQIHLDAAERVAAAEGVIASSEILEGNPGEAIAKRAHDGRFDLIVTGTHGRKGVQRLLLGSTAEGILRRASAPVLAVKG